MERLHVVLSLTSLTLVLAGCGGVQRAAIGAPMVASATTSIDVDPVAADRRAPSETRRSIVRSAGSSVEVTSGTLFASFESKITRFRGRLDVDAQDTTRGRVVIDFDMTSFENPSRMITLILQHEFLEVDTYPRARLDATFRAAPGAPPGERLVEGMLDLHGVQRAISFKGRMTREGDDYRFTTAFDIDRRPFGVRQHDEWDWLNKNDFRVRIDLRGTPERVTVEEIP